MSSSVSSSTQSVQNALLELDPDRKYPILPCHTDKYAEKFLVKPFGRDVALIIARYVVDGLVMDRQGWQKVYGVDIGEEADTMMRNLNFDQFYAVYHGPNPVDVKTLRNPIRPVCESCLIPIIVPKSVMVVGRVFEYNLNLVGQLADYEGINGHRAKYAVQSPILEQYGRDEVEEIHLHIQLEDVVARGKDWNDQVRYLIHLNAVTGYGCAIEPRALAQITAIFATYALIGKRHLGDGSGEEGRNTMGRTAETIGGETCHVLSGNFTARPFGGSASARLSVYSAYHFTDDRTGVGIQRKFR